MNNFQKLSKTEMEVMQIIWEADHPITSSELLAIFLKKKGKEWKGQTMSTFLARLVEKGLLTSTKKQGRTNIYSPRISLKEYQSKEAKSLLEMLYEGSVKNFLATLYDGKKMTEDEVTELRSWFTEKAGEKE